MATRKEIEDQIAALQAEADAMEDTENDYEVEIWNERGEGARVPHAQGKNWLAAKFPELFPSEPDSAAEEGEGETKPKPKGTQNKTAPGRSTSNAATKYFGKRPAGK